MFRNNPISYSDVLLDDPSTDVTKNKDGTYTVVDGKADGDRSIYVQNNKGERTGEVIGKSLTEYSFLNNEGGAVRGAIIDPQDKSGQDFLNKEIIGGAGLSLTNYMENAKGGQKYDFKVRGMGNRPDGMTRDQYKYRGMPFEDITHFGNRDGNTTTFASGRDFGNVAAGYIAGINGLKWGTARLGFDGLESYQRGKPRREGQPSQQAERVGHGVGIRLFNAHQLQMRINNNQRPVPFGPK